jgi:hypothetical protein
MLAALRRSLRINPSMTSELCAPDHLIMLVHGCGNDRDRLSEVGQALQISLPAPKGEVVRNLRAADLTEGLGAISGTIWYVMGRPEIWSSGPKPRFPAPVRIFLQDERRKRVAHACWNVFRPYESLQPDCIPPEAGTYSDIADVVDKLAKLFYFICQA